MDSLESWYDGRCMALISQNGIERRCNMKVKNKEFCHKHSHKNLYDQNKLNEIRENDINILNINQTKIKKEMDTIKQENIINNFIENINKKYNELDQFEYTLMDIYNSWKDINLENIIKIDGEYWDLNIIINIMAYCINNSNMENPYSTYPSNPFTRKLFSVEALLKIKKKILELKKQIHVSLKIFLNQPIETHIKIYKEASQSHDGFSKQIIDLLKKKLRFMIINSKNSQDLYTGMWIRKNFPLTKFEALYKTVRETPYQIFINNTIIENPARNRLQYILSCCKDNYYDLYDQKFYEYL